MLDALVQGLALVLRNAFSLMLVGMALGFVVGLLPGIGGAATLALMLPFVFKMSPVEAFAFCSECTRLPPRPATSPRSFSAREGPLGGDRRRRPSDGEARAKRAPSAPRS